MSETSEFRHLGASEFPNDNPALHDGAIWVCFGTCGPLRPVVRPRSGRASTIPVPPVVVAPALPPAENDLPAIEPDEAPVTEVAALAPPHAEIPPEPLPTLELELTPATAAAPNHPGALDLDPIEPPAPEGCSLSAGLRPVDDAPDDLRASELRECKQNEATHTAATAEEQRASDTADAAEAVRSLAPVDVECTPSSPHHEAPAETAVAESPDRKTILPPPSEDGARTITLTKIHVTGRSSAPSLAAPPLAPAVAEASSVAERSPGAPSEPSESSSKDPFAAFRAALVEVALAAGATRAAAVLPGFLDGTAQDVSGFSDALRASLTSSGFGAETAGAISPSASFTDTSSAWRMVLRGESNDFSACGRSTLDGWAADVLKAFGVASDGRVDVRRELRRRGVAAFGMILAA